MTGTNRTAVLARWLGRVDYDQAWEMQREIVATASQSPYEDQLLLLEHAPVFTLGRRGDEQNLLANEATLRGEGITVRRVDRGGDITYHGPGQLVGYPLLDLKRLHKRRGYTRPDLHLYLREIEEMLIETLRMFEIEARRFDGYTGVWVDTDEGLQKIAAIGIKVSSRGISSHGFALNVMPNLAHFDHIIPCGIQDHGVTSMARLLARTVTVHQVIDPLVDAFSRVFDVDVRFVSHPHST